MARLRKLEASFTGTGTSDSGEFGGEFNLSLSGFGTATVALQRSFDDGSTWVTVESFSTDAQRIVTEVEPGIFYRLNCTAYTSGTIVGRISGRV